MNTDTKHFKTILEEEKKEIEASLQSIAIKGDKENVWENAEIEKEDSAPSDRTETAESITEHETNAAVVSVLDERLLEISSALSRIEEGTYGTCQICGNNIEPERLEANPSSSTCKTHINN